MRNRRALEGKAAGLAQVHPAASGEETFFPIPA
jgi:hypothetical protein